MPCHLDLSLFIIICARYIVMRFLFALIVRLALFDFWYRSGSLNYSIQPNQFAPGANLRLLDNEIEFYRKLIHTSKKKKSSKVFSLSMFFRGSATSYLRILQLDFSVTDKLHAPSVLFNDFTSFYVYTRSIVKHITHKIKPKVVNYFCPATASLRVISYLICLIQAKNAVA